MYFPLARWKYRSLPERPQVSADTELVIEGFARSGNTFSKLAFEFAQPKQVKLLTHLHTAAAVIAAVRMQIPTVVLIRKPEDAILSAFIQGERWTIKQQLKRYLSFYMPIFSYNEEYLIALFDEVVDDFAKVIHLVNERFGTTFEEFVHTPENVNKCFRIMDEYHLEKYRDKEVVEMHVNRPSEERKRVKESIGLKYHSPELKVLRSKVNDIFSRFIDIANKQRDR